MDRFTLERNNYRRKLIMLVKQHPMLWNKKQENYNRNRSQKIIAWHQISEQLDITVDKLRRTWENLRDQYRRDLKREVRYGFKSKWRFFTDMDFIRDMVSCKEHELKEHDFTDSESELDISDNQPSKTQYSPVSTTHGLSTTPTITTTPCSSTISTNTTCLTNMLPFQPIVLSKQWLPPIEDSTQVYNLTPTYTNFSSPTASDLLNNQTNCDSSKDYQQPNKTQANFETVTKQEPDVDLELENASVRDCSSKKVCDNENVREFQEPCVSTSCHKRPRASIEEIIDVPNPAPLRTQNQTETDLNVKDDDYYFVMSLLPSLRQIPRNRKFPLRIGIMSLIAKDLEEVCKE